MGAGTIVFHGTTVTYSAPEVHTDKSYIVSYVIDKSVNSHAGDQVTGTFSVSVSKIDQFIADAKIAAAKAALGKLTGVSTTTTDTE